jgi:predicted nucleic acid-binding protein
VIGSAVIDASVAMKWFVEEDDGDKALLLVQSTECIAPAIIIGELANGLWSKRKASCIDLRIAQRLTAELPQLLKELVPIEPLIQEALSLAFDLDHPVYDCVYQALARSRGIPLITADKRFFAKASAHDQSIILLADWTP